VDQRFIAVSALSFCWARNPVLLKAPRRQHRPVRTNPPSTRRMPRTTLPLPRAMLLPSFTALRWPRDPIFVTTTGPPTDELSTTFRDRATGAERAGRNPTLRRFDPLRLIHNRRFLVPT